MTKEGFERFERFCALEFNVENLYFWKKVAQFHQLKKDEDLDKEALIIFMNHFRENSPLQVNVSHHLIDEYTEVFAARAAQAQAEDDDMTQKTPLSDKIVVATRKFDNTFFDDAFKEVLVLMCSDILRRFKVNAWLSSSIPFHNPIDIAFNHQACAIPILVFALYRGWIRTRNYGMRCFWLDRRTWLLLAPSLSPWPAVLLQM